MSTVFGAVRSGLSAGNGSSANTSIPAPRDPPLRERVRQGLLVDEAAARGVDDDHAWLDGGELLGTDQPDRLRAFAAGGWR